MDFDALGREQVHTRQITCKAYRRRDGWWEVEGSVYDQKAEEVAFRSRPALPAGGTMHQLSLKLIIDNDYTIHGAEATTTTAPWPACGETDSAYRRLIGLRIGPGFSQQVREHLGGPRGCTHLNDLLGQVANTYMQASWPDRMKRLWAIDADPRRWPDLRALQFVGECHAWQEGGEALRQEYPELAGGTAGRATE